MLVHQRVNHPKFPSPQESYRLEHCDDKHMAWYRAIGNAVSVPVISAVAQALLDALELLPRAVPMAGAGFTLWIPLVMTNSLPWKVTMLLIGKASIKW